MEPVLVPNADDYADDRLLSARQSIYHWQQPKLDLPSLALQQLAGLPAGATVVDVGCGNGMYLRALRDARPDLLAVGLDLSPGMASAAGFRVVVGDAQRLPMRTATADAALAMHMLYHPPDIAAAIAELHRVLRSGGVLLVVTNGLGHHEAIDEVLLAAIREVAPNAEPPAPIHERFGMHNAEEMLALQFGDVERIDLASTIPVPEGDVIIGYVESLRPGYEAAAGGPAAWSAVMAAVEARVSVAIERDGVFVTTTASGMFVCR